MSKVKSIVCLTLVALCGIMVVFIFLAKNGVGEEPALDDAGITYQYCKAYEYANYSENEAILDAIAHGRYDVVDVIFKGKRADNVLKSETSEFINVVSVDELRSKLRVLQKVGKILNVGIWDFDIDSDIIETLGTIPELRSLHFSNCKFGCNFEKLRVKDTFSLSLHNCRAETDWQIVFQNIVSISELKICQCNISSEDIQSVLKNNTKLRHLEMRSMDIPPNFSQSVSLSKNLKKVTLHGVTIGAREIDMLLKIPRISMNFCDMIIED